MRGDDCFIKDESGEEYQRLFAFAAFAPIARHAASNFLSVSVVSCFSHRDTETDGLKMSREAEEGSEGGCVAPMELGPLAM